ncbi:MAG: zinc-binding metallopeptidase family protein, partial [Acidimicrobiales bacterium]
GMAPNVVPALTTAKYYVRARSLARLEKWSPRVKACFEAGSVATGASLEFVTRGPTYSEFHTDEAMAARYVTNAESLGRIFPEPGGRTMSGSTDMANVSLSIPSIHPMLGLDCLPAVNHQPEFTEAAASPEADRAVIDGATAMAWTIIDLAQDERERGRLTEHAYASAPR